MDKGSKLYLNSGEMCVSHVGGQRSHRQLVLYVYLA